MADLDSLRQAIIDGDAKTAGAAAREAIAASRAMTAGAAIARRALAGSTTRAARAGTPAASASTSAQTRTIPPVTGIMTGPVWPGFRRIG